MSFRRVGVARGIGCVLEAEKEGRSFASLRMTNGTFSATCAALIQCVHERTLVLESRNHPTPQNPWELSPATCAILALWRSPLTSRTSLRGKSLLKATTLCGTRWRPWPGRLPCRAAVGVRSAPNARIRDQDGSARFSEAARRLPSLRSRGFGARPVNRRRAAR